MIRRNQTMISKRNKKTNTFSYKKKTLMKREILVAALAHILKYFKSELWWMRLNEITRKYTGLTFKSKTF